MANTKKKALQRQNKNKKIKVAQFELINGNGYLTGKKKKSVKSDNITDLDFLPTIFPAWIFLQTR